MRHYWLKILVVVVCTGCIFQVNGKTKVYKYVDSYGQVQFTDRPTHDGFVRMVQTRKGWRPAKANPDFAYNRKKFAPIISAASKKYGVSEALINAVIHAESHFDPHAISSAGAMGLMQLMPGTAMQYGVWDRQNPTQNIDGGVKYLKQLIGMFDGNLKLAVAAYNAGENAVKRYGNQIPPYKETRNYVAKVTKLHAKYLQRTQKS